MAQEYRKYSTHSPRSPVGRTPADRRRSGYRPTRLEPVRGPARAAARSTELRVSRALSRVMAYRYAPAASVGSYPVEVLGRAMKGYMEGLWSPDIQDTPTGVIVINGGALTYYATCNRAWSSTPMGRGGIDLVSHDEHETCLATNQTSSDAAGNTLPSNNGWKPEENAFVGPGERISFTTERHRRPLGRTLYSWTRKRDYYINTSSVGAYALIEEVIPGIRPVPAPLPSPQPQKMPDFIFRSPKEMGIVFRPGRPPILVPNPQPRPVGGYGKARKRSDNAKETKLQGKRAMATQLARAGFWLLETIGDAKDIWEVFQESFPPEFKRLSWAEQARYLSDPLNWANFDSEGFVRGIIRWYAEELLYGRIIGGMEKKTALRIGASSEYGVGVGTRYMSEWGADPLSAFEGFLFGN